VECSENALAAMVQVLQCQLRKCEGEVKALRQSSSSTSLTAAGPCVGAGTHQALATLKQEHEAILEEHTALGEQYSALRKRHSSQQQRLAAEELQVAKYKQRVGELTAELQLVHQENVTLTHAENGDLLTPFDAAAVKEQMAALSQAHSQLQTQNRLLHEQNLNLLTNAHLSFEEHENELLASLHTLRQDNASLVAEHTASIELQEQLDSLRLEHLEMSQESAQVL
jgi:hypothetical protein